MRIKTNESIICSRCLVKSRANGDLTAKKGNTPMHATINTPQELKAIKCMEVLNIYKPYIDIFKKQKTLCLFENFAGFYLSYDSQLITKKQEIG